MLIVTSHSHRGFIEHSNSAKLSKLTRIILEISSVFCQVAVISCISIILSQEVFEVNLNMGVWVLSSFILLFLTLMSLQSCYDLIKNGELYELERNFRKKINIDPGVGKFCDVTVYFYKLGHDLIL